MVGKILEVIDKKHEENIQMAKQLHQIYEEITAAKLENGENGETNDAEQAAEWLANNQDLNSQNKYYKNKLSYIWLN